MSTITQDLQGTGGNTTYNMQTMVYANGLWVCGSNHGIWWSEDGKVWTQGTGDNTTYNIKAIVHASGLWFCESEGHGLWWSEDGKAWIQATNRSSLVGNETIQGYISEIVKTKFKQIEMSEVI